MLNAALCILGRRLVVGCAAPAGLRIDRAERKNGKAA